VVLAYQRNSSRHESKSRIPVRREFKLKLQNAISSLTEAQREVFLNRIDGKKYREIADL
jgi:RNA polymerase sigma-70 factor (ECF subfamily)